ncbi:hypothetical protein C1645_833864 [Glomus cerebriforme]|uniref:Uncharacterized protein n=1 Tax=Glomus cerebriforme TaxID=658196 RepID=A0A397SKU2_9GLOM|nr:hypothetical protein C1645_833864 [Glomus cerebriforme]
MEESTSRTFVPIDEQIYEVFTDLQRELIDNLHYGPYSREWWLARLTSDNTTFCPIRLVVQGNTQDIKDPNYNEFQPGYICQSEGLHSNVCESSSKAITSVYQKAFSNKTKHAGPLVMGFDIPHISEALLSDYWCIKQF